MRADKSGAGSAVADANDPTPSWFNPLLRPLLEAAVGIATVSRLLPRIVPNRLVIEEGVRTGPPDHAGRRCQLRSAPPPGDAPRKRAERDRADSSRR